MTARIRLGELLTDLGLISSDQLEQALSMQKQDKRRLGELLVLIGAIDEAKVTQVLSQQLSVPWVSLQHIDFSRQLLNLVSAETAQKYSVVPIYVRRGRNKAKTLYIAMQDPSDDVPLEEVAAYSGLPVRAMIAPPSDIRGAIRAYYLGLPPEEEVSQIEELLPPLAAVPEEIDEVSYAEDSAVEIDVAPAPESAREPVPSREPGLSPPQQAKGQKMVTLTMLDGTTISLPAHKQENASELSDGLTAGDLVEALRAQANGADVSEVLGDNVNWERVSAALIAILLKKHLINDWEFVRELQK